VLREKGTPAAELRLLDASVSDEAIIEAMIAHPILVNRPIIVTPRARSCAVHPSRAGLLDRKPVEFTKEDGEIVRL